MSDLTAAGLREAVGRVIEEAWATGCNAGGDAIAAAALAAIVRAAGLDAEALECASREMDDAAEDELIDREEKRSRIFRTAAALLRALAAAEEAER